MTVPYAMGASVFTGGHQRHERFKTTPQTKKTTQTSPPLPRTQQNIPHFQIPKCLAKLFQAWC